MAEGVQGKIKDDLLQAVGVPQYLRVLKFAMDSKPDPRFLSQRTNKRNPIVQNCLQLQRNKIRRSVAMKLQNIIDGRRQRPDSRLQMLDTEFSFFSDLGLLIQYAGPKLHAAQ